MELLVVIAIIGILIALLLPAVQAAREAARRTQCANQVKQIGLGLHNYHDSFKTFPVEGVWANNRDGVLAVGDQRNFSWIAMMLPYLEQTALHDQIDFSLPVWPQVTSSGDLIRATRIPGLECPSDSGYPDLTRTANLSWTCYAGSAGWDWWDRGGEVYAGVFTLLNATRIADIQDGTSNTIAVGEVGSRSYQATMTCASGCPNGCMCRSPGNGVPRRGNSGVYRSALVASQWHPTVMQDNRTSRTVRGPLPRPDTGAAQTAFWQVHAAPYCLTPLYVSHYGPNSDWHGPSSLHPGGAQFLLADGSVRFISETISWKNDSLGREPNLWQALHTVAGHNEEMIVGDF